MFYFLKRISLAIGSEIRAMRTVSFQRILKSWLRLIKIVGKKRKGRIGEKERYIFELFVANN